MGNLDKSMKTVGKKVIFITHGNKNIGMGHVMRCVSLAGAFRKRLWDVKFYSKFQLGYEYIEKQQFQMLHMPIELETEQDQFQYGSAQELEREWEHLSSFFEEEKPDVIVVDSYNVTNQYFDRLRSFTKCLLYIDDVAAFSYHVDVVLNPNFSGSYMKYEKGMGGQKFFLGVKYCLLREEFTNMQKHRIEQQVTDVLITTGAADPENMSLKIAYACFSIDRDMVLHIVVGKAFVHKRSLEELQRQMSNVILYENPPKMSEIMQKCDLAIAAGGSTLYELSSCGIPTLAFIYAENQRLGVELLEQDGYIGNLGDCEHWEKNFASNWQQIVFDYQLRKKMSEKMQKLVDGRGADRVVEELEKSIIL